MRFFSDRRALIGSGAFCLFLASIPALASSAFGAVEASPGFAGPDGWRKICAVAPQYCNTTPVKEETPLDSAAIAGLAWINSAVNAAIVPLNEPAGEDVWQLAPTFGDCEDYALTKKHYLLSTGWSAERLRFATVITETNEYHAVLFVDHATGRLVLDNRFEAVREWDTLEAEGYRLVAVEGIGANGAWHLTAFGSMLALLAGHGPAAAR